LKATHRRARGDNNAVYWIPDTVTGTHRRVFDDDGTERYIPV
jgi:hypothetical protein